jgi:RsiW-degrading membrane proteinase PrsW (M82 family)
VDRTKNLRNVAIILVIAAAVFVIPGGGQAANTFAALLLIGFGVAIGYLGLRFYREYRVSLYGLGDNYRGLAYVTLAIGGIAVIGRLRMWQTGLGVFIWFMLVGFVVSGLVAVIRRARSY